MRNQTPRRMALAGALLCTVSMVLVAGAQDSVQEHVDRSPLGVESTAVSLAKSLGGRITFVGGNENGHIAEISFSKTKLSDDHTELLSRLHFVKKLDLSGTCITDVGFLRLATLRSLAVVNVGDTRVTPTAVREFERTCSHLVLVQTRSSKQPKYFSPGLLADEDDTFWDLFRNQWYSSELDALHEPSLQVMGGVHSPHAQIRLLVLPAFSGPSSIRLDVDGETVVVTASQSGSQGDLHSRKPVMKDQLTIGIREWERIREELENGGFWQLESNQELGGVADATTFVMECRVGDQYKVVFWHSAWRAEDEAFKETARYLRGLGMAVLAIKTAQ